MPSPDPDPVVVTPVEEADKVYFDWQQPGFDQILKHNQLIRDNRLSRTMDWGVAELEIPVAVLHFLKRKYPDLDSKDSSIKTKAWKKYLASPASAPYRVRGKGRFLARSTGGLEYGGQSGRADGLSVGNVSDGKENGPAADAGLCRGAAGPDGLGD